ncbi:MAG: glycine zipper 2TM domain-containing protein [Luteimonas sp.]
MKRATASILALGLLAGIGSASAQSSADYSTYRPPAPDRYGQGEGGYYDYARVLRVDPVIDTAYSRGNGYPTSDSQHCYTDTYAGGYGDARYPQDDGDYRNDGYEQNGGGYGYRGTNAGANVATVIGGLVGAAVGSQVGGGSARYATAALGTMVGGMAGRQVYDNTHRRVRSASVQVCDPVPDDGRYDDGRYGQVNERGVTGYDVTYEYAGHTYTTRTNYNPGDRIRVRVDVTPG